MKTPPDGTRVVETNTPAQFGLVAALFREYAAWLEAVEDEAHVRAASVDALGLPGIYAPPDGCLLLAQCGAEAAGCAALRRLDRTTCEMKRLYVRPAFRERSVGRLLVRECVSRASALGYERIRLETLAAMREAGHLYRAQGFREIPPYGDGSSQGRVYYELNLR